MLMFTYLNIFNNNNNNNNNNNTTLIPEMLGRFFLNLNKMKTKRLSNHMSQYFIHNRTEIYNITNV